MIRASIAVLLSFGTAGCITSMLNEGFAAQAAAINEPGPNLKLVAAEQLATVKRVAVMPFRDLAWRHGDSIEVYRDDRTLKGRVFFSHADCEDLLAERFEEILLAQGNVEVVERSRLAAVFAEQGLAQSGAVEAPPEVVAAGAGADAVILGSLTMEMIYIPDRPGIVSYGAMAIHVRVVDTRNGKILAFGDDSYATAEHLINDERLMTKLSERLGQRLGNAIAVARDRFPEAKPPEKAEHMSLGGKE